MLLCDSGLIVNAQKNDPEGVHFFRTNRKLNIVCFNLLSRAGCFFSVKPCERKKAWICVMNFKCKWETLQRYWKNLQFKMICLRRRVLDNWVIILKRVNLFRNYVGLCRTFHLHLHCSLYWKCLKCLHCCRNRTKNFQEKENYNGNKWRKKWKGLRKGKNLRRLISNQTFSITL